MPSKRDVLNWFQGLETRDFGKLGGTALFDRLNVLKVQKCVLP